MKGKFESIINESRQAIADFHDIWFSMCKMKSPKGFGGFLRDVVEFIADPEHFRNYRSYMTNGGIHHLAHEAGLRIIKDILDSPSSYKIVILAG